MALLLKKQLTSSGVKLDSSFQPVIYIDINLSKVINNIPMISYTIFENITSNQRLSIRIDELQAINSITIPSDASGVDLLTKFIKGLNDAVKAKLLENNPLWSSDDVEIVDL
jgi:hypothetical protein